MNIKENLKNKFAEILADALQPSFEVAADELVQGLSNLSLRDLVELTEEGGGTKPDRKPGRRVAGGSKSTSARLPRRSAEEIDAVADKVASLLKTKKNGMRAEEIRAKLKMDVRELPRVIKAALAAKKIAVLSGNKRSTTYGIKAAKAAKPVKKAKPAKSTKTKAKVKPKAVKTNGIVTPAPAAE